MKTKNLLLLAIALSFVFAVNINTASALPLWQFGLEDQSYAEFETAANGSHRSDHNIVFGNVTINRSGADQGSGAPGYMYTSNPYLQYSHVNTAAVRAITFAFTLANDYLRLDLSYGRFGSEIDDLYFDGVKIFSANGTAERQYDLFEYAITGNILAGDHTLTLAYAGGGAANGHFIDFLRLDNGVQASSIPEPGTVFLFGTGLAGLLGGCRRKIRPSA